MEKHTVEKQESKEGGRFGQFLKTFPQWRILVAFAVMFIVFSLTTDTFCTSQNIINILRQSSTEMIAAMGMTFVLIIGGIDLSVGSVAMLAGTITAGLMSNQQVPMVIAIMLGMLVGATCGLSNGVVSAKFNIPPFIATLAMMNIAEGIALIYCGGKQISGLPDSFKAIGRGYWMGVPIAVWLMIVVVIIWAVIHTRTTYGKKMIAIGGNQDVARLSGIQVNKVKVSVYVLCGMAAALTGIIYTARLASSQPTLGDGLEMNAIAATVLGGTSLFGGRGSIIGTIIGAFFLATMGNGLNILEVSSFWQKIIKGLIIVAAVFLYENLKKEK